MQMTGQYRNIGHPAAAGGSLHKPEQIRTLSGVGPAAREYLNMPATVAGPLFCGYAVWLFTDVKTFLLALDVHEGADVPAKWRLRGIVQGLFLQVSIALLQAMAVLAVVQVLHDFSGRLAVEIILEINALSGQHPPKLSMHNISLQFIAITTPAQ
jgi:hypothetical protein